MVERMQETGSKDDLIYWHRIVAQIEISIEGGHD